METSNCATRAEQVSGSDSTVNGYARTNAYLMHNLCDTSTSRHQYLLSGDSEPYNNAFASVYLPPNTHTGNDNYLQLSQPNIAVQTQCKLILDGEPRHFEHVKLEATIQQTESDISGHQRGQE